MKVLQVSKVPDMQNFRQDEAARRVKGWQTEGEEEGAA